MSQRRRPAALRHATRAKDPAPAEPTRVSLVAIPEAAVSTLTGVYDVMSSGAFVGSVIPGAPAARPFRTEIVGEKAGPLDLASGIPIQVQRSMADIDTTDIVIVPSV